MAEYHPAERRDEDRGWTAPEIARRNIETSGKPISTVMKAAATASELAHGSAIGRKTSNPSSG